jgi:hypothetical protein
MIKKCFFENSSTQAHFTGLPVDIIHSIMLDLDPYHWYILKHVSKYLSDCVCLLFKDRRSVFIDSLFAWFYQLRTTFGTYKIIAQIKNCQARLTSRNYQNLNFVRGSSLPIANQDYNDNINEYRIQSYYPLMDFNFFSPSWLAHTLPLYAAKYGCISLLKWSLAITPDLSSKYVINQAAATAAEFGKIECLEFILEFRHCPDVVVSPRESFGQRLGKSPRLCFGLRPNQSPDNVRTKLGSKWNCRSPIIAAGAARGGQLEILKKLIQKGCSFDSRVNGYAALHGHLSIIEWACKIELKWIPSAIQQAACGGHLPILDWLMDNIPKDEIDHFDDDLSCKVINFAPNPVETLKWMIDNAFGKPIGESVLIAIGKRGNTSVVDMLFSLDPDIQDEYFSVFERGIHTVHDFIMRGAAAQGNVEFIKWARLRNPPLNWGQRFMFNAVKNGHLKVVQLARSMNPPCDWNNEVTATAAKYGRFKILEWLFNNGCPLDYEVPYHAASNGHLEILKWVIENRIFNIEADIYETAKQNRQKSVVDYLISINAPKIFDPNDNNRHFFTTFGLCPDHIDNEYHSNRKRNVNYTKSQQEDGELPPFIRSSIEEYLSKKGGRRNYDRSKLAEEDKYDIDDDNDDKNDSDDDDDVGEAHMSWRQSRHDPSEARTSSGRSLDDHVYIST